MSNNLNNEKQLSIVCIGGGTGLSTMLRGLKHMSNNITAIVTVADDGGGSGVLRDELGMLPPGDIRNCILSLSNIEPTMREMLSYRFTSGSLEGQSFGNLFLAAMNGISDSFDQAVRRMCEVLAITGRVLPVTVENVHLAAEFEDGSEVIGESHIYAAKKKADCRIKRVWMIPERSLALADSVVAIENADLIILGPGSLYTSIIPNLLVKGISEAIERSKAIKLYIANVMSQDGETEGYSVSEHISALFNHAGGRKLFEICLTSSTEIPNELLKKYKAEDSEPLYADTENINGMGVRVYTENISDVGAQFVRHDPKKLADAIMKIYDKEKGL